MGKHRPLEKDFYFNYRFFIRLGRLAPLLFPRLEWSALFVVATLLCSIASEVVGYYVGLVPGKMYGALIGKDEPTFWHIFWTGSLMYIGKCLLIAAVSFFSWMLYLSWRYNAVSNITERYFKNRSFYIINCIDNHGIDNPDQRITQDVEKVCNMLAINVLPNILIGPFVVAWYTYKTAESAGGIGIAIIYGYFVLGTIVNKFLLSPMVKWNARVEKAEGDFRYKHVSIRDNAESLALYNAEPFERFECARLFRILLGRQVRFLCWKLPNMFWQQLFDYYGGILSYLIQIIPIFLLGSYDNKDPGDLATIISNNAFVYIYLVNSFTRMTDVALSVGEMAGILQRVSELIRVCDEGDEYVEPESNAAYDNKSLVEPSSISIDATGKGQASLNPDVIYDLRNVSFGLPCDYHHKLLAGLTLQVRSDENLLVTGNSGCGKTSLLRIMTGLWNVQEGAIVSGEKSNKVLCLPQNPYFPSGHLSLRQQICFPEFASPEYCTEESSRILNILESLDLRSLVERCDGLDHAVEFEWQDTLTPGELQRLAFARVLYHQPKMVILDEATSSVSVNMEQRMYNLLIQNGIHFISLGHRPSIVQFHDVELRLDGKGGYSVHSLEPSKKI